MEQGSKSDGEQQSKGGAREALRQVFSYYGVSLAQTFIEFGVFALLQALGVLSTLANELAVGVSATFNFLMNRNVTFRASSNFARSVVLFVLLYLWNFAFSSAMIALLPPLCGIDPTLVKLITMALQGIWGFFACKYLIFR